MVIHRSHDRILKRGCTLAFLIFTLYNLWLIKTTSKLGETTPANHGIVKILDLHASSIGRRRLAIVRDYHPNLPPYFHLYDLRSKVAGPGFNCCVTRTDPRFPVCVHNPGVDEFISGALVSGGVWEPYLTRVFQIALRKHPSAVVVDIGANIGYYTLLAARMGHSVVAIEPVTQNIRRLHQGALTGQVTERVHVLKNAVSDRHQNVSLSVNRSNQGGIKVLEDVKSGEVIQTITLDDLLFIMSPTQAVIKIDIEGYECRAMAVSRQFFKRIFVPYIFMEWQQMFKNRHQVSPCPVSAIRHLTDLLVDHGYIPHEVHTGIKLNSDRSTTIWRVGDIYWRHKSTPLLIPSL